jgi:hypothetical protein
LKYNDLNYEPEHWMLQCPSPVLQCDRNERNIRPKVCPTNIRPSGSGPTNPDKSSTEDGSLLKKKNEKKT